MIGIYGIFRKSDDKCMYVGQSKDIYGRIKDHLSGKSNTPFNKEDYYGDMIEQHFINDKAYRLQREAYWIKELNPKLNKIKDETNRGEYISGEKHPMFGKHHTEESNKKNGQAHLDRKWINNGTITKKVKPDEIQQYLSQGWKFGRIKT